MTMWMKIKIRYDDAYENNIWDDNADEKKQ
jgi:hypothetical protein